MFLPQNRKVKILTPTQLRRRSNLCSTKIVTRFYHELMASKEFLQAQQFLIALTLPPLRDSR
jgi:hypothetical protein